MAEWLKQLQRSDAELDMAPTVGAISAATFQAAFKASKEKTSSNGDLHYTVWKCMAREDDFADWLSIMMSIPFMFGFAPLRWQRMTDVMLEKKKGVRKIHQLRIIGLLEADLNTALKIFGREMAHKMEDSGNLSDEQWGSRKNRSSIDAALIKKIIVDIRMRQMQEGDNRRSILRLRSLFRPNVSLNVQYRGEKAQCR